MDAHLPLFRRPANPLEEFSGSQNSGIKNYFISGDSYEFAEQNNWQIIKDFAEMTASTPGIWHAANFQVYEYLKAWQDLEISSDGKVAHNPSRHTVWARQDQRLIELPPGDNNLL